MKISLTSNELPRYITVKPTEFNVIMSMLALQKPFWPTKIKLKIDLLTNIYSEDAT